MLPPEQVVIESDHTLEITLTDGGVGDGDPTAVNGKITRTGWRGKGGARDW